MSSRIASGVAHDCFHSLKDRADKSGKAFYHQYLRYLQKSFSEVTEMCSNERSLIRGALVRDFPCTAAIAYVSVEEESVSVDCMWAGDSRVYVLYEKGLLQMTVDDLDVSDAMKNLSADGALTNVISSDGNYEVHGRSLDIRTCRCRKRSCSLRRTAMKYAMAEKADAVLSSLSTSSSDESIRNTLSMVEAHARGLLFAFCDPVRETHSIDAVFSDGVFFQQISMSPAFHGRSMPAQLQDSHGLHRMILY